MAMIMIIMSMTMTTSMVTMRLAKLLRPAMCAKTRPRSGGQVLATTKWDQESPHLWNYGTRCNTYFPVGASPAKQASV